MKRETVEVPLTRIMGTLMVNLLEVGVASSMEGDVHSLGHV